MSVALRTRAPGRPALAPRVPAGWRAARAVARRGLRDQRLAPFTWGGTLGVFSALVVAIYPSIEDSLAQAVQGYPEGLKEAFGIGELDTVEAYLHAEMLSLIVPLAIAFLAVRGITRVVSAAEDEGHLDVVLSAPLTRPQLVAGAFAAMAAVVAASLAVVGVLTWLGGALSSAELSGGAVAAGVANVLPLAVLFGGLAALLAGAFRGAARVTAVALGTFVAMYLIDVLGRLSDAIEPLRFASAFRHYGRAAEEGIDPVAFAGLTVLGVLLAAAGARLLVRRDIRGR